NKWQAYEPITIAYNVPLEVVAKLEMRADEMEGISTIQSTTRVYPWGGTASHIIGYLSRQVSETTAANLERMGYSYEEFRDIENIAVTDGNGDPKTDENGNPLYQMTKLGYSYNDYIGVAGVERTMERYLTASSLSKRGRQTLEVNKHNAIMRELSKTYASDGDDVMLTIDLPLQIVVENALQDAIEKVRAYEEEQLNQDLAKPEDQRDYKNHAKIKLAETGSIVVLEANTGKLLALASYPSYDPNRFMQSISTEDYEELFGETSNMPTLNRAISTRMAPGSIFKMATGLAGLMEGAITTASTITDNGPYMRFESSDEIIAEDDAPRCWISNRKRHMHENLNLSTALGQSCNYFFFTVADRLGMTRLKNWTDRLGLGNVTGVELPAEIAGITGGQSSLYNNTASLDDQRSSLPYYIYRQLKAYLTEILEKRGTDIDDAALDRCARQLLALQDGTDSSDMGNEVRRILRDELNLPITLTRSQNWVLQITSLLSELKWKAAMTIRSGMGQGITAVTPVAVARYAAAIANRGTVYDVHVVDRVIDGDGKAVRIFEPTVYDKIDAPEEYWDAIAKGLERVVSDEDTGMAGTAYSNFTDAFISEGYNVRISGKSGTAQISTQANNIDIENTSWFITMMPREAPEIVVITCIPYGLSGSTGSRPAVEAITRFYLDRKDASARENLVQVNGLMP
ncbi:MAG: hypothetical protein LBS18_03775, partial [Clostridiales bacterium]|nr:hypothetical protein [Clostridiales bacterium]